MKPYKTMKYSVILFPFINEVSKVFNVLDLNNLHSLLDKQYSDTFKIGADSCTNLHNVFYDKYRDGWPEMLSLYDRFIKDVVSFYFDEDFLYQCFPTFRVHLPGNVAVGAFHADGDFGHPDGEINFILPLTNSDNTASVWVESEPKLGDYIPMEMRTGELIRFNGNKLTHGNKSNETTKSRVSMDFRILPISKYKEDESLESKTTKQKYTEGAYYKKYLNGRS